MKPTKDEARNGWTEKSLAEYLKKRRPQQQRQLDFVTRERAKPQVANNRYDPHRWR